MNTNRLTAMRAIADNLQAEGQTSRAACVRELCFEVERLEHGLRHAHGGFAMAFDAAQKKLNDEVLLHCGHHHAMSGKVLEDAQDA